MRELDFSKYLVDTLNDIKFSWRQNAIILGATSGSGGGIGGPVGGIIGQLGQTYVAGDTDELRTLSSGSATSLLWNLNRIRYWETNQISTLAPSPTFTGQIWVDGSSGSAFKMRNESDTAWITLTGTGGSTPLDANAPLDVAASASVGTSGSASHGDHAHRGVSSVNVAGYPYAYDHVEIFAGAGATITQSSGSITIANASSGSNVALGAGALSITSPNDISSGSHTHQVLTSSNPGAAASILSTNASGQIHVQDIYLGNVYGLKYENSGFTGSIGWGLTGSRTLAFPDTTGTLASGAGTLTYNTTNDVTLAAHTHAITNSSNPGAAASLLATDASGNLAVVNISTNGTKWGSGTSFPGSPATSDRYFRTDLGWLCYYDGTRWLTDFEMNANVIPFATYSATTNIQGVKIRTDYAPYITRCSYETNVATTNNATNYWTVAIRGLSASFGASTTIDAFTTASDTAGAWTEHEQAPSNASVPANRTLLDFVVTKTLTPGNITLTGGVYYRLIVT